MVAATDGRLQSAAWADYDRPRIFAGGGADTGDRRVDRGLGDRGPVAPTLCGDIEIRQDPARRGAGSRQDDPRVSDEARGRLTALTCAPLNVPTAARR